MAADDLERPLKRRGFLRRIAGFRPSGLGIAMAAVLLAGAGGVVWLNMKANPLGGEPVAVLPLEGFDKTGGEDVAASDLGIREGLKGDDAASDLRTEVSADGETAGDVGVSIKNKPGGLPPVPVKALTEHGRHGLLPKIASDGRRPSQVYARHSSRKAAASTGKARIAILVGGMGLSAEGTTDAIDRLPAEVTLAFAPYPDDLQRWVGKARQNGHEVMLQLPMEPFDYPNNDPGPYTLLTRVSPKENIERLEWLLSRFTGYFGVTNYMGAKFTSMPDAMRPTLKQISARGLAYVDDGTSARSQTEHVADEVGLGYAAGNIVIDAEQTAEAIDAALDSLEEIALERGLAIGVASGLPVTIDRISEWARALESRNIVLVPVSATIPAGQS